MRLSARTMALPAIPRAPAIKIRSFGLIRRIPICYLFPRPHNLESLRVLGRPLCVLPLGHARSSRSPFPSKVVVGVHPSFSLAMVGVPKQRFYLRWAEIARIYAYYY